MDLISTIENRISHAVARRCKKRQLRNELRDLRLWDLDVNERGHLSVQGLDAVDLITLYGSPLLVVNRGRLIRDALEVKRAFQKAPEGSKILYSYKTNCIPGILKPLHDIGIGAEVISPYELWLAARLGVSGEMILYNGVDKSEESIEQAVAMGVLAINIDHSEEVERLQLVAKRLRCKASVGVRLALRRSSQFGLDIESGEALDVCRKIRSLSEHLALKCLHFHVTSNAKTAETHKTCVIRALEFARVLKDATGLEAAYLDIGGGLGVPTTKNMTGIEYGLYRALGIPPKPPRLCVTQAPSQFMSEIFTAIKEVCGRLHLKVPSVIIEPGRLITSRAEFLLSRVNAVKRRSGGRVFAIADAGRLSLTFPCDFEYHEVFVANRPLATMDKTYEVKGRICTSADWMFRNRCLPQLEPGDILAVMDAGAYFSSHSSNFAFPRPGIIMVQGGTAHLIRRQETYDHLIAMDVL